MKYQYTAAALLALVIIGAGCGKKAVEDSGDDIYFPDGSELINLPSSVAKTTTGSAKAAPQAGVENPDEAIDLYEHIREWIGFADNLVHDPDFGVKALIVEYANVSWLDWKQIKKDGSWSSTHTEGTTSLGILAEYRESNSLHYRLTIRNKNQTGEPIGLQIEFNGDWDNPAGRVFYDLEALEAEDERDSVKIEVAFSKTSVKRTLDISITTDQVPVTEPDGAENWRFSMEEQNGIVYLSGCSYHPGLDSILADDTTGHCYLYTVVADTAADLAVVKLGIPPATISSNDETTLFTTYGIARLYGNKIIRDDIPNLLPAEKQLIVTSYKDSVTLDSLLTGTVALRPETEIDNITLADLEYFLELNQNISDVQTKADLASILWIIKLDQPVYFDNGGYVGNGDTVPVGFETVAGTPNNLDPFVPSQIKALVIP